METLIVIAISVVVAVFLPAHWQAEIRAQVLKGADAVGAALRTDEKPPKAGE